MTQQNTLRQTKNVIYQLKRTHGRPITVRKNDTLTQGAATGEIARTFTSEDVKRALVLPAAEARKFVYDLSYIAANNNFVQGAYFDQADRFFVIDHDDVSFEITEDHQIIYQSRVFEILKVAETTDHRAWAILGKDTKSVASVP